MISNKATTLLSAGIALFAVGLIVKNLLPLLMGLSLTLYVLVNWLFYSAGGRVLFSDKIVVRREFSRYACSTGDFIEVKLTVENRTWRDLDTVRIIDHFDRDKFIVYGDNDITTRIKGRSVLVHTYQLKPVKRGIHTFGGVELHFLDSRGLFFNQRFFPAVNRLTVFPGAKILTSSAVAKSKLLGMHRLRRKGIASEFGGIRDYNTGDPLKFINWKASARSVSLAGKNRFMVNEFESEVQVPIVVLLDVSYTMAFGGKLDYAVEATSAFVDVAYRNNDPIGIVTFSDEVYDIIPPATGKTHCYRIIRYLTELEPKINIYQEKVLQREVAEKVVQHIYETFGMDLVDENGEPDMDGVTDFLGDFYNEQAHDGLILRYAKDFGIDISDAAVKAGGVVKSISALRDAFKVALTQSRDPSIFVLVSDMEFPSKSLISEISDLVRVTRSHGHGVIITSFFSPAFESDILQNMKSEVGEEVLSAAIEVHTRYYMRKSKDLERALVKLSTPLINITSRDIQKDISRQIEKAKLFMGAWR